MPLPGPGPVRVVPKLDPDRLAPLGPVGLDFFNFTTYLILFWVRGSCLGGVVVLL